MQRIASCRVRFDALLKVGRRFAHVSCGSPVVSISSIHSEDTMVAGSMLLAVAVIAQSAPASPAIVFVCEHGAAKSVIATAYFNKLAAERGLPFRATFRGTDPQAELSQSTLKGLREDGIDVPTGKPTVIAQDDVAHATHVFAIGCTLPAMAKSSGKASDWSDVPDGQGYGPMRDAIVRHVKQLLDELQR
jgi:arsenate reductase